MLISKYNEWKSIVKNPKQYKRNLRFFYDNPDWPMFSEMTKIAEESIPSGTADLFLLKWFDMYPPRTSNGLISYCSLLLKHDKGKGRKYINQTWTFQNLSADFVPKFQKLFKKEISEISYAKQIKRLMTKNENKKLKIVLDIVPNYMKPTIQEHLEQEDEEQDEGYIDEDDADKRYNSVKKLTKQKKHKEAANLLISSNSGETKSPTKFLT